MIEDLEMERLPWISLGSTCNGGRSLCGKEESRRVNEVGGMEECRRSLHSEKTKRIFAPGFEPPKAFYPYWCLHFRF